MFLYHLNEFRKAAAVPAQHWAKANDLFLQWTTEDNPISLAFKASNEMLKRTTLKNIKPTFGIENVSEEILVTKPFCTLRHFKKNTPPKIAQPKMLITAPLSGHFATLLRDTVTKCLQDFDVYITDWVDACVVPTDAGEFSLDTYVDYLLDFLRFLGPNVHVLAVCQPAVPVLMATALLAEHNESCTPASMILMGGPIDARINPGSVNEFASSHSIEWLERNVINRIPAYYPGANRRVCPGFIMLNGFMLLNIERHQDANWKLFKNLVIGDEEKVEKHIKFYDEYRAVMDLPATYFLDSIEHVFQKFSLATGRMLWRDQPIKTSAITTTKLLTIEGELDEISPPGQTKAAHNLCKNIPQTHKAHHLQKGVGHYGIFNGSSWREKIYPLVANFCLQKT